MTNRISTGIPGLDVTIDMLRPGDNVVWQVHSIEDYRVIIAPYAAQSIKDGRRLVYLRFGRHAPLLKEGTAHKIYELDASKGFESFATAVHKIIENEGRGVFYIFDCLSDLLEFWYSDLLIGNFFKVTCPYLFRVDAVTYFALMRNSHTYDTIARIRETTQLLLDVYIIEGNTYIHPLKVWERYSPTMFFPHFIKGGEAISITASAQAAELFSLQEWDHQQEDYWDTILAQAKAALNGTDEALKQQYTGLLIKLILGREGKMRRLVEDYFELKDMVSISRREIGTGRIGGKSVGMLLARRILKKDAPHLIEDHWEPHDSFYIGADVFYTYIVQNGWWELLMKQKTAEGYFTVAPKLREKLPYGKFPQIIKERFMLMLEHFGQSPIIVRSSSLLEDDFGNAFAGKYESVFCANQGSPEDRYAAFEKAVKTVYASSMGKDALSYRKSRGLRASDEQMAILVQRVSGDHYGALFFPHVAGVGNSQNVYVWDKDIDPDAGMARIVFGLGTRAVDRVPGDHARLIPLDNPTKPPPVNAEEIRKFTQHNADLLDLFENTLSEQPLFRLVKLDLKTDKEIFFSLDTAALRRLKELGREDKSSAYILDFKKLLEKTDFPAMLKGVLDALEKAYDYPVDIEFTANFSKDGTYKFNLLQCRPLQTKMLGKAVELPTPKDADLLFSTTGNFMGGNAKLIFDYAVFVKAEEYLALGQQNQYAAARLIGDLNRKFEDKASILLGPGRFGTTTPSLGIPVRFTEIDNMNAICEYSYVAGGVIPELSFGSHFFQDIVESGLFYAAIFSDKPDVHFFPGRILKRPNLLNEFLGDVETPLASAIHVAAVPGLALYADVPSQKLVCFLKGL